MDKRLIATLYGEAKSMRGDLDKIDTERGTIGSGISAFVPRFNSLLSRVQNAVADDPVAAQSVNGIDKAKEIQERLSANYHKAKKFELMTGLAGIVAALEPLFSGGSVTVPMRITREGVFFAGEYFEPLRFATDLIAKALKSIVIIDNYLGHGQTVLDLVRGKAQGVVVRLLSRDDTLQATMLNLARAFQKEHGNLELRTSQAFHDRFIIIDDTDFYHFGASLKDMGSRGFMFSRIEEPDVIGKVRTKFAEEWDRATVKI